MNIGAFNHSNIYINILVMIIISIICYLRLRRRASLITTATLITAIILVLNIVFEGITRGYWYWETLFNIFVVIPLLILALLVSGIVFFIAAIVEKKRI